MTTTFWRLDFLPAFVQQAIYLELCHKHPSALTPSSSSVNHRNGLAISNGFIFPQRDKAIDPIIPISDIQ